MCNQTTDDDAIIREKQLRCMLKQLRITAIITKAHWDDVYSTYSSSGLTSALREEIIPEHLSVEYMRRYYSIYSFIFFF